MKRKTNTFIIKKFIDEIQITDDTTFVNKPPSSVFDWREKRVWKQVAKEVRQRKLKHRIQKDLSNVRRRRKAALDARRNS